MGASTQRQGLQYWLQRSTSAGNHATNIIALYILNTQKEYKTVQKYISDLILHYYIIDYNIIGLHNILRRYETIVFYYKIVDLY